MSNSRRSTRVEELNHPHLAPQPRFTISSGIRFLIGLSNHKLPSQAQLSKIIASILSSPIFTDHDQIDRSRPAHDPQPDLIRSLAGLLLALQRFTELKNQDNQLQRLIHALVSKQEVPIKIPSIPDHLPTIPTTTPTMLMKKVLLMSFDSPNDLDKTLESGLSFLKELFEDDFMNQEDKRNQPDPSTLDRLVAKLVKFLVNLHHNLSDSLKDRLGSIQETLSDSLEQLEVNDEGWEIIDLIGDCINGFFGTRSYWDALLTPARRLSDLLTQHKEDFLQPFEKLKVVILDLFNNFEEQLYSPQLYHKLGLALEEFKRAARLVTKPTQEIIKALETIRLQALVEDDALKELVNAFQQVSIDLIDSMNSYRDISIQATRGAAKTAFNSLVEYLIPRLLLLIEEIPSPRIEFISPTLDAVFDPASFTSNSGFLPSSIVSTTVHRVEVGRSSSNRFESKPVASKSICSNYIALRPTTTKQKISISGLRLMSKNIGFYVHKKVNPDKSLISKALDFTNFEDEGKLDIFFGMGEEDGLSLELDLSWNYHAHRTIPSDSNSPAQTHDDLHQDYHGLSESPEGLFLIKSLKLDLKGFGIFPHNSNHPIVNWFLKPGFELYVQTKIIQILEEYLGARIGKLNQLLGKVRLKLEERSDDSRSSSRNRWEKFWAILRILTNSEDSNPSDDHQAGDTRSEIDNHGLTIKAEDDSYIIRIGIGQKLLPNKGVGGPGNFQDRLERITDSVAADIDRQVDQIVDGIAQARMTAQKPGWQSSLFDLP